MLEAAVAERLAADEAVADRAKARFETWKDEHDARREA